MSDPGSGSSPQTRRHQTRLRRVDGSWVGFAARLNGNMSTNRTDPVIAPYCGSMTGMKAGPGGEYPLWPVELFDSVPNPYGRFDGIFATTGFGIGAETVHTRNGLSYIVFPNIYRTDANNFFAVRLD